MTFDDLKFVERLINTLPMGVQARHDYPNGYGVSIVKGPYSYGGDAGLYELAVMRNGRLVYDTPITEDVEGYLDPARVTELMQQVEALPAPESENA